MTDNKGRTTINLDIDLIPKIELIIQENDLLDSFTELVNRSCELFLFFPVIRTFDTKYTFSASFETVQRTVYLNKWLNKKINIYMSKDWGKISLSRYINLALYSYISNYKNDYK